MTSVLNVWTEEIIRRLKRDRSYHLDRTIGPSDLFEILAFRGSAVLRGFFIRPRLRASQGILFVGKRVTIRHKQKVSVGRSVIIDDQVTIDALSVNGVILGNNVTIARNTTIQCTGVIQELGVGLIVGDNSAIGAYSFLGAQGGIKIGRNVIMGPMVSIHSENHSYEDSTLPIRLQPVTRKGITIEDDCWIGAKATIVDGVDIGSGCVIAAGTVVTKNIPPNSLVVGVPGQVVKSRTGGT